MTKKRLLVASFLLLALLVIGLGVAALIPEGPGISKANFDRIEMGMTMADAERVFGRKGGQGGLICWGGGRFRPFVWAADDGSEACIEFQLRDEWDSRDTAIRKSWMPSPDSTVAKVRRWLRI